MDYIVGKMKEVKKKVKRMQTALWVAMKESAYSLLFVIFFTSLVSFSSIVLRQFKDNQNLLPFLPLLTALYTVIFTTVFNIYVDRAKTRQEIIGLKSTVLLELRYTLISLIENFTRFYVVYFTVLRFFIFDLKWFYELTEKYREYFPDYLMNDIKICKFVYENLEKSRQSKQEDIKETIKFLEEYIKEMQIRSLDPTTVYTTTKDVLMVYTTMENVLNNLEKEKSKYKENKLSIKPIHIPLLTSMLNNLSTLDKDFVKDIFYIRYEINKLNDEIEVLRESSQTDLKLILSILQRTKRIAIKIDEILEKEGTKP